MSADPSDPYLVLVNNNLPLSAGPAPALAVADDATGQQLEQAAADAYRAMADAAGQVGIRLTLEGGYQTAEQAQQDFDARKQGYLDGGMGRRPGGTPAPPPSCPARLQRAGHRPGRPHPGRRVRHPGHRLCQHRRFPLAVGLRADYGFILRWPEDRQAATGMCSSPGTGGMWGSKTPAPSPASGLSLEEFLAVSQLG